MVVGNGLMASKFIAEFKDDKDILIFASGVSNSKEDRHIEFTRELELLKSYISQYDKIVYFSTSSIYNKDLANSPYVLHKKNMEEYIKDNFPYYLIIRASNIIGPGGNKATIINYIFDKINNNLPFELWVNAKRNILDIDDFAYIVKTIINLEKWNEVIDVYNFKNIGLPDIVSKIEQYLDKKGNYTIVTRGGDIAIDTKFLSQILPQAFITRIKSEAYLDNILKKYYS